MDVIFADNERIYPSTDCEMEPLLGEKSLRISVYVLDTLVESQIRL